MSWPCCLECDRPLSAMMRSDARWCSPRCRQRAYRRTMRQSRNGRPCGFCGERLPPSKRRDARYCDAACRGKDWTRRYENDLERLRRELRALKRHDSRLKVKRMFDTLRRRSSRAQKSVDQLVRVAFLYPALWDPHLRIREAASNLLLPNPLASEDDEHAGGEPGPRHSTSLSSW